MNLDLNQQQSILITITGLDKPGITATFTQIIAQAQADILDIGQSVLNDFLCLSILVPTDGGKELLKDLLFEGKKMGVNVEFRIISNQNHVLSPPRASYIISCISPSNLSAAYMGELTTLLAQSNLNIQRIDKTSRSFQSLDITCSSQKRFDWEHLKSQLIELSHRYHTDISLQKNDLFRWSKRLIVFDMDSTLIQTEVVNEIAKLAGVKKQVEEITEQAMNGELDFTQSLKKRVALFKGISRDRLANIAHNLPITPGVVELIQSVKKLGYKLAVISGGFTYFANHLKEKLGLDYAFANELEMDAQGLLTGRVVGTIVDAKQKAVLLNLIAQQESICLEQTVAVGDGANDLEMLTKAGLGVAFYAKPIVRRQAQQQITHTSMDSLLYFLGVKE